MSNPTPPTLEQPAMPSARAPLADAANVFHGTNNRVHTTEPDAHRALLFSSTGQRLLLEKNPNVTKAYAAELKRNLRNLVAQSARFNATIADENVEAAGLGEAAPGQHSARSSRGEMARSVSRAPPAEEVLAKPCQTIEYAADDNLGNEQAFRPGSRAHDICVGSFFSADPDMLEPLEDSQQRPSPTAEMGNNCDRWLEPSFEASSLNDIPMEQWNGSATMDHFPW